MRKSNRQTLGNANNGGDPRTATTTRKCDNRREKMTTNETIVLELNREQFAILKLLLEFHMDDEPEEYYPFQPYHELCELVESKVSPELEKRK
jgi:hypothetical protein